MNLSRLYYMINLIHAASVRYLMPTLLIPESYKFSFPVKTGNWLLLLTAYLLLCFNCYNHHLFFENIDTHVWLGVMSQLLKSY
jgi:hypothetical protein